MSATTLPPCDQSGLVAAYAVDAVSAAERATAEAHLASCAQCRDELARLAPVVASFDGWPTDLLRPPAALQQRLAQRLAADGQAPVPPPPRSYREPDWEEVAPGISVKMLAQDKERHTISMLVRLVPGGEYPPHNHAGIEELHLLDGELWINDQKLYPGDYNFGAPGARDLRVMSETGCTCVLVTSTRDILD